jgi:hypothetical protein
VADGFPDLIALTLPEERERLPDDCRAMSRIDRGSERLLAQFLTFAIDRNRHMQVAMRRQSEQLLEMQLSRGGVQQVRATDYVCDPLLRIIDYDGKLIGEVAIGAQDYEIVDGFAISALHAVVEANRLFGRCNTPGASILPASAATANGIAARTRTAERFAA